MRVVFVVVLLGVSTALASAEPPAQTNAVARFVGGKHAWGRTAALVVAEADFDHPAKNVVHAEFLIWAMPRNTTLFTSARFRRVPIDFWLDMKHAALAKNRLFRTRLATTFLLANPGMHGAKLSELALDPYAVLCLPENASAVADVDYATLSKKRFASNEALLVAAARSPNSRADLTDALDKLLVKVRPKPNAKMDGEAAAKARYETLAAFVAVVPDADWELLTTTLRPRAAKIVGAQFVKDLDELVALLGQ